MSTHRDVAVSPANRTLRSAGSEDGWLTAGGFALALGLLIFISFPGVLLGGQTFVFRDYGLFSYPVAFFHKQSFWRGELPLWNPLNYCGVPFLAQWNTMTLYPLSLIYLVLPLPWSLSFFCLAHLFWGGLGMYFLAFDWTSNRLAAALGGVVFAFNGLMLNFLMWPSHVATFSWVPWVLWLVPPGWRLGGKQFLWGVLAAVMQMLAGAPETIFLTWVTLFALACGDWMVRRKPTCDSEGPSEPDPNGFQGSRGRSPSQVSRKQIAVRFIGTGVLVALICAAQLLPFLELLSHSQRGRSYGSASHDWSIPFWGWANFLVPLFRTSPTRQGVFFQNGQYWTSSYYAGIGTILLIAVALRRAREWRVRLLAAVAFLCLILAWGDATELYKILSFCFPGLGFVRYPVKFVILVSAIAPLLAACGLQASTSKPAASWRFEWTLGLALLCLVGIVVAVDWNAPILRDDWWAIFGNALFRAGFLVLAVWVLTRLLNSEGRRRTLFGGVLLAVFWGDLITHVPSQNPAAPSSVYSPGWAREQLHWKPHPSNAWPRVMVPAATLDALRQSWVADVKQNYLRNRLAGEVDCNILDAVPHVDGFFSLVTRETYQIADLARGKVNVPAESLLDFLGVSEVTARGKLTEWMPRNTFMPLVTSGQRPVFVDEESALAALGQPNLDLRQVVYLPLEARDAVGNVRPAPATVRNVEVGTQKICFAVECPADTILVVSESFYPAWKAHVDENQVRVWRANYGFIALQVPRGKHQVQLIHKDRAFETGIAFSVLGVAAWVSLWLRRRLTRG